MLDTTRNVETPEGIELALRVAGPMPRALAWLLDMFLRGVIYSVLGMSLPELGDFGMGLFLLALFLLEWFYPVAFELLWDGATPGKRVLGLRVINDDGTPVRAAASVLRNLMRSVDFLPVGYALGVLCMLFHRDFKRIGDMAAGTLVVYASAPEARAAAAGAPVRAALPPAWPLSIGEQKTLIDFAERHPRLTGQRAEELARAAGPLVAGSGDAAERLLAHADWLAGQR